MEASGEPNRGRVLMVVQEKEPKESGEFRGHPWVRCTYCDPDGFIRCGGLPPVECPICFGSRHDFRSKEHRERDAR